MLFAVVAVTAASCFVPPVDAPVIDAFRPPACRWCAGNRGLEYGTTAGMPVRAVAAGTVTFSGSVAGTGYLVVRHSDGRRVTYGGVRSDLTAGRPVVAGMVIASTTGRFHLGLRHGSEYLDPAPYIGRPTVRARLVPADGSPPRPAGAVRFRCSAAIDR